MVKFTGDEDGRAIIGLGLTRGNVERLMKGQPIRFALEGMNIPLAADVFIFFGENEKAIADDFVVRGKIGPGTKVAISHRARERT